jgi:S-DNA-T family DNA segregation ATPase FtsK/SpoIIIE
MLLIISIGVSGSNPVGQGLWVNMAIWVARGASYVSGALVMVFCFLLILSGLVKLAGPDKPLPRFVWGMWVLFVFTSGIYHSIKAPWEDTFAFARPGGGGGVTGACVSWFFRIALGRVLALVAMGLGVTVGLSLIANKTAYAPFSLIWMASLSGWQWFRKFLADFFRAHGPSPDEIETDFEQGDNHDKDLELAALLEGDTQTDRVSTRDESSQGIGEAGFSSAVADIRERLRTSDVQGSTVSRQPSDDKAQAETCTTENAEDFASLVQPSLHEELFYEFPSLDILQKSEPQKRQRLSQDLEARARIIEKTLLSFGVVAKVVNYVQGPAVTQFELQPGPGVKISSIVNLSQDIALALAAQDIRMEAPIPGKSAVGIEVPNRETSLVHLRDVLETREFRTSKSPLTIALGKDISGRSVITTLDRSLHLLIAGATGAGKSVCINCMIASILFKARPDQVKLVLIDPKRVELSVWAKIPHLIAPVVSDPKKASGALRWAIKEMESRYEKFTKVGTRDIERYNQVATPPDSVKPAMPYIVIIIDELSDLMMVAPAEVEDCIFRLAQMARAAGIYLVVATQRPSVDVITGTIKANIPSRIAFAVASQIDSRTILDMGGAEKLLGRGDMLFAPVGATKPVRAQGCYVSEREIDELVSFVSSQAKPQFAPGILSQPEVTERETEIQEDPFFAQALRIVVEAKQASVSLLQRKLPIGYSRAARLIDAMESKGYVGPYEGSKPREVRISIQEYMRRFEENPSEEAPSQYGETRQSPRSSTPAPTPSESRIVIPEGSESPGPRGKDSAGYGNEDLLRKPSFLTGKESSDRVMRELLDRAGVGDRPWHGDKSSETRRNPR